MSKAERKVASDAALASVKLEGFIVPEDTLTATERYIEGKIKFQELILLLYSKENPNISDDRL